MEIRRTANAGVLVTLDGVSVLLDGVCRGLHPYLAPPKAVLADLAACPPDAAAFTHAHPDHFDADVTNQYRRLTGRPVLGTEDLRQSIGGVITGPYSVGGVKLTPYPGRHIGPTYRDVPHVSWLLEGSRSVFFVGDASPLFWHEEVFSLRPDVLIVPYLYVTTHLGRQAAARFAARHTLLVHMPAEGDDPEHIWQQVREGMSLDECPPIRILAMGERITVD